MEQPIIECNRLDISIRNRFSFEVLEKCIFFFMGPSSNSLYNAINMKTIVSLTRLRVGLNYLSERKFKHGLLGILNLICPFGSDIKPLF